MLHWPGTPRASSRRSVCETCSKTRPSKANAKCSRRSTANSRTTWSTWMRRLRRLRSAPDFFDGAQHQGARRRHRVFDAREHGRLTSQQTPVFTAQDSLEVLEIAVDGVHVRIAAVEQ